MSEYTAAKKAPLSQRRRCDINSGTASAWDKGQHCANITDGDYN